jgi:hypothetical protein
MTRRGAAVVAACILGFGLATSAHASRFGGRGGGSAGFHGGGFHGGGFHHGGHFRGSVFIGGAVFAPWYWPGPYYYPPAYYPPAYYPPATEYIEPQPSAAPAYWYYCPGSRAYYPYVRDCPGGWQPVAPQPPQ